MLTSKGHKVEKDKFLQALESVRPGLSPKPLIEHSNSFIFRRGYVEAFNDEVACRMRTGLPKECRGIVASKTLLSWLTRNPDDVVSVMVDEETRTFKLRGRNGRWADLLTAFDDKFEIDAVERPGKSDWHKLSPRFGEAVGMVAECASRNEQDKVLTFVHVAPGFVEASDDIQWCRFKVKTLTDKSFIVKRDSIRHITKLDMTEFAQTDAWVHFRNPAGLVFSCRRTTTKFPDVSHLAEPRKGKRLTLPKELDKEVDSANVFASEDKDQNAVVIDLEPGRMKIKGVGVTGKAGGRRSCDYRGKPLSFLIQPKMLVEITKRGKECSVETEGGKSRMRMIGDRWNYITDLASPRAVQEAAEKRQQVIEAEEDE